MEALENLKQGQVAALETLVHKYKSGAISEKEFYKGLSRLAVESDSEDKESEDDGSEGEDSEDSDSDGDSADSE